MVNHIRGGHIAFAMTGGDGSGVDKAQYNAGSKHYCQKCGWWVPKSKWSDHEGECPLVTGIGNPYEASIPAEYTRPESPNAGENAKTIPVSGHQPHRQEAHKLLDSCKEK